MLMAVVLPSLCKIAFWLTSSKTGFSLTGGSWRTVGGYPQLTMFLAPKYLSPPLNNSSSLICIYVKLRLETMETSSTMTNFKLRSFVRIIFPVSSTSTIVFDWQSEQPMQRYSTNIVSSKTSWCCNSARDIFGFSQTINQCPNCCNEEVFPSTSNTTDKHCIWLIVMARTISCFVFYLVKELSFDVIEYALLIYIQH